MQFKKKLFTNLKLLFANLKVLLQVTDKVRYKHSMNKEGCSKRGGALCVGSAC